jgi:hypothetical protein
VLPDHGADPRARKEYAREIGSSRIRKSMYGSTPVPRPFLHVVMGADGPDARSRLVVMGLDGRAQTFERSDGWRFLRYSLEPKGDDLVARPVAQPPIPATLLTPRPADTSIAELPASLSTLEVVPGPAAGAAESPSVRLRIRASGRPAAEADFPRKVLQRLVLGAGADLSAGNPLPGLGTPQQAFGSASRVMALMRSAQELPPWSGAWEPLPGEEDPVKLGVAAGRWWAADPAAAGTAPLVVLGTSGARSVERWEKAPAPVGGALLLLPDDAFPGPVASIRDELRAAWGAERTVRTLAPGKVPDLVVLASAEPPALLGARLRALARDPALKGKLLAVWPIGGAVRGDLPASLLDEGNLAGLGLGEWSPVGLHRFAREAARLAQATSGGPAARKGRAEELAPFFAWYF